MTLKRALTENCLVFDAAMGTALQKKGADVSKRPEVYNIENPAWIDEIHRKHIEAGADVMTTNTFGANGIKLEESGYSVAEIVAAAVTCARRAAEAYRERQIWLVQDLGPIGTLLEPSGTLTFDAAYDLYVEQVKAGIACGVDGFLIETQTDLLEAKCAILAVKAHCDLPIICTMSFEETGRTFTGTAIESMAVTLEALGVAALGLNCSFGPEGLYPLVEQLIAVTDVPIVVQPNSGLPTIEAGETVYAFDAEAYERVMTAFYSMGVAHLGGCCGTTEEAVRIAASILENRKPKVRNMEKKTRVCSYAQTVVIGETPKFVGERLNPTGRRQLKEALRERRYDFLLKEACAQVAEGAHILDVNVGLPGIDEAAAMCHMVTAIQKVVDVPLQIDASDVAAIEAGLRRYNGVPIVNSVNGKASSMAAVLPLVKKYGACVIALTLDENGIPESVEARLKIAERIIRRAEDEGIPRHRVLVDCLTLTVSAQPSGAFETLEALRRIKEELGVCTVLGVSNVSFGLPKRVFVHQTFLTMALSQGLDLAIVNPAQEEMQWALSAFRVLKGHDVGASAYIAQYGNEPTTVSTTAELSLESAIEAGLKDSVGACVDALLEVEAPMAVVETRLIPMLNSIGARFESGELFLPQLIQVAETAGVAFERIKRALEATASPYKSSGIIVLATVEHDVHDIGKNVVKVVLENYGFDVYDLGRDVPAEAVLKAVQATGAQFAGLSALMTTTVPSMAQTVELLKREAPHCTVIVGGAVVTASLAETIGADYYAKDPGAVVHIMRQKR